MRARLLKPGFFRNEDLAKLDPHVRLLFAGLWCIADREGRLEDRPQRIRADVFPYEGAVDVEAGLSSLREAAFLERYEVDGVKYIQILAFKKHQNAHCREAASEIPAPCEHYAGTVPNQCQNDAGPAVYGIRYTETGVATQLKGARAAPARPDWLPPDAWHDWHTFRNQRKGWTPKARELSLATLRRLHADGNDPVKVINRSIERGWTGLFPLPENERHAARPPRRKLSAVEQVEEAIRERREREAGRPAIAGRLPLATA